jgi:beta-lactamase class A
MDDKATTAAEIEGALSAAGLDGCVHAVDIDRGTQLSYRGDELCAAASTGKVPILVALMRAVMAGAAALDERITIAPGQRTAGPSGLSVMSYPAELALGDVAQLMISVSDNHATDIVLGRVSPQQVTAAMRELGLMVTALDETVSEEFGRLSAAQSTSELDLRPAAAAWRTTPAEMCALLRSVWLDQAASGELCARMRQILRSCLTSNGLDSRMPIAVQARTAGKTGTLFLADSEAGVSLIARNEVGVLEFTDGGRYAVAVYTRQLGGSPLLRDLNASRAIGTAAQLAVDYLRVQSGLAESRS